MSEEVDKIHMIDGKCFFCMKEDCQLTGDQNSAALLCSDGTKTTWLDKKFSEMTKIIASRKSHEKYGL